MANDMAQYRTLILWQRRPRRKTGRLHPQAIGQACREETCRRPGRSLVEEANALVDDFAAVLEHTLKKYQGRIKPEEAKAFLITAYIQRGRNAA